jgi:hypothetical protein
MTVNDFLTVEGTSVEKVINLKVRNAYMSFSGELPRWHILHMFEIGGYGLGDFYNLFLALPVRDYYGDYSNYFTSLDIETGEADESIAKWQKVAYSLNSYYDYKTYTSYRLGTDDQVYKLYSMSTPLKVNFNGSNAELNSTEGFMLDVDGFKQNSIAPLKTSGGLNVGEAWLILDDNGNGTWQNNSMDNDDLFGDHLGQVANGYVDMAKTFARELKADEQGQLYIELDNHWWTGLKVWVAKLFGDKTPYASTDLKLLTIGRQELKASDYIKRFYVSYKNVSEYDGTKHNAIFQRAKVVFKDGTVAQSADQYYSLEHQIKRKATAEEIKTLKAKGLFNKLPKQKESRH